jgi:Flagellar biosynthesis protein, FliO
VRGWCAGKACSSLETGIRSEMNHQEKNQSALPGSILGGLPGLLLSKLRGNARPGPRLELLERISLAPRQSLALVEAEGRRFLVATSQEGAPAFYALDRGPRQPLGRTSRVSW